MNALSPLKKHLQTIQTIQTLSDVNEVSSLTTLFHYFIITKNYFDNLPIALLSLLNKEPIDISNDDEIKQVM